MQAIENKVQVAGYYDIFIKRKNGVKEKVHSGTNLILNQGLDRWMVNGGPSVMNFIKVGTGTTEPAVTDTDLVSELASTATKNQIIVSPALVGSFYEYTLRYEYTFALGAVVGNITELGVAGVSANNLNTRALIRDGVGNPTAITVTAEEQLIIIYSLVKRVSTADIETTLTLNVNGVTTNYAVIIRLANANENNNSYMFSPNIALAASSAFSFALATQDLGIVTSRPAGSSSVMTATTASYTNGTFYRDYTIAPSLTQGNIDASGIGSILFSYSSALNYSGLQMSFNPKLPKNADRLMSIPLRVTWARS